MKTGGLIERQLTKEDMFNTFLIMLGANYPKEKRLTDGERKVVLEFMKLTEDKFRYNRFSNLAKKKVCEALGMNKPNLDRYLQDIRKKGYVEKDSDNIYSLNKMLNKLLEVKELELNFKFKVND